jgi:hypothetical protein
LKNEVPGLAVGQVAREIKRDAYRLKTYELHYGPERIKIDFEMESDFEWYTGNKQDDPDWVYSPQHNEYQIWGGVKRLAERLLSRP